MAIGAPTPFSLAFGTIGSWLPCRWKARSTERRFGPGSSSSWPPTLQAGDLVVLDNLGSHKVAGVREAIEARGGGMMFLPSYSPDLNPIEQLFAKFKAVIRRLAPRSLTALVHAVNHALDHVSPAECANYLCHAGYVQSG